MILVGRTGLDAKLRADPDLELLRVRNAMEAIAELGDPIDELSPAQAVVVFGEGATPGLEPRADESLSDAVAGLRLVDPGVAVLATTPLPATLLAALDGAVDPGADSEDIADQIRAAGTLPEAPLQAPLQSPAQPPTKSAPEQATQPAASHPQAPATAPKPVAAVHSDPAIAMASGQDPVESVLASIRSALADRTVTLANGHVANGAAIVWHGRVLGTLLSETSAVERLAPHAESLAPWLAIRHQFQQLRLAAYSDPLTGAWNRRYFDQFLQGALGSAREHRHNVTILVFDIDNFKMYNDRFGHEAGDEILIETVRLLRSVIRPTDRVCRIGGDEFAVIFNEPQGPRDPASRHPTSIHSIAARFQSQVRSARFPKLGTDAPGTLTISGGLATYPWDGTTPAELLRRADELAIEGKRQGKNVIMFGPGTPPDQT
ncbi:MAG: diguanylate cyclase [Phycisphaerales bacterium]|nr:diguanylate cyclase [Phycisphaerales bacterium]